MRPTHPRSFRAQADQLRRQFLQDGGLPFTDILTEGIIAEAWPRSVGGWIASSPRWSPCGCSSVRRSAPTTPAGPPSPV
jgi:hypothetical protein